MKSLNYSSLTIHTQITSLMMRQPLRPQEKELDKLF